MTYIVEYKSPGSDKWNGYAPITHKAHVPTFKYRTHAAEYQEKLERQHPRDSFRITKIDPK
jgi:hypothetical protein